MTRSTSGGDTKNFADHPESVAEVKANKSESARLWTPRDALISALRDIDQKKINPFVLFCAMGSKDADGGTFTRFVASGSNNYEIVGVATRALWMFEDD